MAHEIAKMLVLSTAHLSEQTCLAYLPDCRPGKVLEEPIIAFEKGEYGWFVHVSEAPADSEGPDVPLELRSAIHVARREGCQWIMFDRDGDTIDELPTYEW